MLYTVAHYIGTSLLPTVDNFLTLYLYVFCYWYSLFILFLLFRPTRLHRPTHGKHVNTPLVINYILLHIIIIRNY